MPDSIHDRLVTAGLPPPPRGVWLEIDVAALTNNVEVVRELIGRGVNLGAVVKADGYGHGLKSVALAFESAGADRLCVASLDEAVTLREAGVTIPILVLFSVPSDGVHEAARNRVEITASDLPTMDQTIRAWQHAGAGGALAVHVEIETGLTRAGVKPEQAPELIRRLNDMPGVRLAGVWTHLASPEEEEFTADQVAKFESAVESVRGAGLPVPPRHVAATGGLLTGRARAYEGVRIGLGLYGMLPLDLPIPEELQPFAARLRPAMALKCLPLRIETFQAGTRVSYGGRWTTERESVIATLPVGYADAIPRPAPWGEVLVRGRRVPLVGTVAMDAVMADVSDVSGVGPDDEFVILGRQGDDEITAEELSRARNTIPWEVATGMSHRLPRVYHAGSVLMGLRTLDSETRVAAKGDRNA